MPPGGKLIMEACNMDVDEAYSHQRPTVPIGAYVMLSVSDTGTGMDESTLDRIFEPSFTTKERGKGTGLGLATVYGIGKQSGGHIGVYSEPGRGTAFKIYFPRTTEKAHPASTTAASHRSLWGTEAVLLVEDQPLLRRVVGVKLRSTRYKVLEAARAYPGPIELLISDVILQGMNGRARAEQLLKIRPETKVLFVSVAAVGAAKWRWIGAVPSVLGFSVALRCIWDFGRTGRGTPAPFVPPQRRVVVVFFAM